MTEMKLSEAIRQGSKLHPQSFGMMSKPRRKWFGLFGPEIQTTCALMAACEAASIPIYVSKVASSEMVVVRPGCPPTKVTADVPVSWREPLRHETVCPYCSNSDITARLIAHMNDKHRVSREEIADWVEEIELYLATKQDVKNTEKVSE